MKFTLLTRRRVTNHHGWMFIVHNADAIGRSLGRRTPAIFAAGSIPYVVSWRTRVDGMGRPLAGDYAYVLHFDCGHEPPARGVWSIALYDRYDSLVSNSIHRYALGDSNLRFNSDASLDIFIRGDSPGRARETNWLPAPAESFHLAIDIAGPAPEAADASWHPPAVRRADDLDRVRQEVPADDRPSRRAAGNHVGRG